MDDLLVKIADILDMSVDGVLASYPVLRDQYANAYVVSRFLGLINSLAFVLGAIALFLTIAGIFLWMDGEEAGRIKTLSVVWGLFLIVMIISIMLGGMVVKLAPDLMFIESLLQSA